MEKPYLWESDPGRKIIIYGAGYYGSRLLNFLFAKKIAPDAILCFFDSNPVKSGTAVSGIPVVLPTAAHRDRNPIVILAHERVSQQDLMRAVCDELGYESIDYAEIMSRTRKDAWTFTPKPPGQDNHIILGIVDSCNISCANCTRIHRNPENIAANIMPRGLFNEVLDRAAGLGFPNVDLMSWSEPFLHPEMEAFADDCSRRNLTLSISSNLSLPRIPALIPTLEKCAEFMISVSGFTQEMHSRNHRGSDIEVVKKHIGTIAAAKRRQTLPGIIYVKYLDFGYNHAEVEPFRKYAADLGIDFHVMHGITRTPIKSDYETWIKEQFVKLMRRYSELRQKTLMEECAYRERGPIIDYKGDVYLCCTCLNTPFFRMGNFLHDDFTLIQALRQTHPYCAICGMEWAEGTF